MRENMMAKKVTVTPENSAAIKEPLPNRVFTINDVKLTGRELGKGSYGVVFEVIINHDQMVCAGKVIHEILEGSDSEAVIKRKYLQECEFMSKLDHPNIAKFLGICYKSSRGLSSLPMLLTEKLDMNLDEYLSSDTESEAQAPPTIPFAIKRSVLEDVARGLVYLHCEQDPPIIHRDLTARNVLLTKDLVAKITDFGNSRLCDLPPGKLPTQFPGTLVYMPPEACSASQYDPSLDIFSFGHLALFVGLQVFPGVLEKPSIRDSQSGELQALSEVQRRGKYFDQLEKQYADQGSRSHVHIKDLVAIIKKCLDNDPKRRYITPDLLSTLQEMKIVSEESDAEEALEKMIHHWNIKAKRNDPIVLVVTGKPGVGKSTLLNNFLGLKQTSKGAAKTALCGGSVTTEVSEYEEIVNGITVKIIDMPGLSAPDIPDTQVKSMIAMLNAYTDGGKADLLLYCCSMVGSRIDKGDTETIKTLNQTFRDKIWERTILVLTHADHIEKEESDSSDGEDNDEKPRLKKLGTIVDSYCRSFLTALKDAGVTNIKDVQSGSSSRENDEPDPSIVIAMPAYKKPKRPADWIPMLFREVLKRCNEDAIPALLELHGMTWKKVAYILSMNYVRNVSNFTLDAATEFSKSFLGLHIDSLVKKVNIAAIDYATVIQARAKVCEMRKQFESESEEKVKSLRTPSTPHTRKKLSALK